MKRLLSLILIIVFSGFISPVIAANEIRSQTKNLQLSEAQKPFDEWGITPEEWTRYKKLMAGSRGIWSPNADPLLVLGAHARNDAERNKFAELYVKKEYERTNGELAFQRSVSQAWQKLFPGELRIKNDKPSFLDTFLSSKPVRYALVLEPNCTACRPVLDQYINKVLINRELDPLDIYVRNIQRSDEKLRQFVTNNRIPVEMIRDKRITINHGDQYQSGKAPAVWVLQKDGQWKKIN